MHAGPARRTNTAREMLADLERMVLNAHDADTPGQAQAALDGAQTFIEVLGANVDDLWTELASLREENVRLARSPVALEEKNSELVKQVIDADLVEASR
jgi:hypothetical protein